MAVPHPQYITGINKGYNVLAIRASLGKAEVFLTIPSNTSNMLGLQMTYLNDLYKLLEYEIQILCFWRWTHV